MLHAILVEGRSLSELARRRYGVSAQALSQRLHRVLRSLVAGPGTRAWPPAPLVLLADGLWFRFDGRFWVLYLMAIKSCQHREAIFLDPVLLPGRESAQHWARVFATLPGDLRTGIRALIADDLRGMVTLAVSHGWILQLCHFHLISQLHARRGRRQRTVTYRAHREALYRLVRRALDLPEGPELPHTLRVLRRRVGQPRAIGRMAWLVREFLRRADHFRAYRRYPEWNLPTTTGAVEAMAHRLRSFMRRLGNLRTPQALQLWATALIRMRPAIMCNGKESQPNFLV